MPRNISGLRRGGPGRPKGSQNKATVEVREFARTVLEDPAQVESMRERMRDGRAPHLETLLFHYAYGKPKDVIEMHGGEPPMLLVDVLTQEEVDEELRKRNDSR